jgi:hypothetical protein
VAEPQNIGLIHDALFEVTGRKLLVVLESGEGRVETEQSDDEPAGEDLVHRSAQGTIRFRRG